MKKKSIIKCVALVLCMAITFTACKKSEPEGASDSGTTTTPTESTDGTAKAGEYDLNNLTDLSWFSDVSGWFPTKWDLSEGTNFNTISKKTGVEFTEFNCPPEDASTKLGLLLVSGKLPDFMTITDENIRKELIISGAVWDLQELLETYLPDSHLLKDFPQDTKDTLTYRDGGWYVFPSHYTSFDNREKYIPCDDYYTTVGQNQAIIFNTDILEQAGLTKEDVATEDGFFKALEKVKGMTVDGGNVIPVMVHGSNYQVQTLTALKYNFGVVPIDKDGNYISDFRNPGYKNVLSFLNRCIRGGYLDINLLTVDDTVLASNMESGRVFCFIGNQSGIIPKEGFEKFESFGAIRADDGSVPCLATWKEATSGWLQTLISKNCKDPVAAARFLDYMTSDEGLYQTQYGNQGEDYTLDDKGLLTKTDVGQKKIDNGTESGVGNWWCFYNDSFAKSIIPAPAENTLDYKGNELSSGFTINPDCYIYDTSLLDIPTSVIDSKSDLGIAYAQLAAYKESAIALIITAKDDASFEQQYQALLDKAKELGVEKMDTAYDAVYKELSGRYSDSVSDPNANIHY